MRSWSFSVVAVVAVSLLALFAAPARADDSREEARRAFAAGQAADRNKDWETAIEHYLRANELVSHPFALYNIAVDYERLGKLREAAVWYGRYLEAAPQSPDRDKVARTLRELSSRPASIAVRSVPSRARVLVDAVPVGQTPYSGTIRGGSHRIVVELDGRRAARDVTVEYGEPVDLELALGGGTGTLRIEGEPVGAQVLIDGNPVGVVPATLPVPEGAHSVRIAMAGYAPHDTSVQIEDGRETTVRAQLPRALGSTGLAPDDRRKIQVGYLFGAVGGADVRGSGELLLGELGVRANAFDLATRIGKVGDLTAVDLFVRWTLTPGRLAPYVGLGYSFGKNAGGYNMVGGLRLDVLRGERFAMSVLAESGLRVVTAVPDAAPGEASSTEVRAVIPVLASLVLFYRYGAP